MSVMQKRSDGADVPDSGRPGRPTKAKRKGKAGAPKRRPAKAGTKARKPPNKADTPETKWRK